MLIHDLRNPLSVITSTVDLFLDGILGILSPEQKEYLELVKMSAKILAHYLADLDDINYLETLPQPLKKAPFSSAALLKDLAWLNDFAKRDKKKINIAIGQALTIFANQKIITRVLEELVLNALKQTSADGKVELRIVPGDEGMQFTVRDYGEGIPPEYLDRVFDKTFKLDYPQLKSKIGGGLSFYFCRLAVEAHGGKISIESRKETGTRIYFTLPRS